MEQFLDRLRAGIPATGVHITTRDFHNVELLGNCGFDYLWIDMEHTELTKSDVYDILLAAKACDHEIATFVRAPENDPALVKPLLDMGANGIIFPSIKTAEDAERAVASCKYPPEGIRGFGPRRAVRYGMDDARQYIQKANQSIWKLLQIETREAYENLDVFLQNPDIDALILGPCDFSGAFGRLTQIHDPEVSAAIDDVIQRARTAGKPIGVSIGNYDYPSIKYWIDKGVQMISAGNELSFLLDGALRTIQNMKQAIGARK